MYAHLWRTMYKSSGLTHKDWRIVLKGVGLHWGGVLILIWNRIIYSVPLYSEPNLDNLYHKFWALSEILLLFYAYGLFKINSLFQISDIVVGQEDVSAKEALLRWAQKTTHRYPGVKVDDFTRSWRDGLAFNAIIHRNRPDLVDWKKLDRRQVRERIDLAFHVMEREYGVTRLLDPEGKIQ